MAKKFLSCLNADASIERDCLHFLLGVICALLAISKANSMYGLTGWFLA